MSYRADKLVIDGHTYVETDTHTQATTIPEGKKLPRMKTSERIFIKFSGQLAYKRRNRLEQFHDVAENPLDPGSNFLFSGSVPNSKIMEKRVNGFSWKVQDMSGMTQQNIWLDCFMPYIKRNSHW